jgi:NTP pyrophosphatase (non-canonical NTP hydrolase)
MTFDEYQERAHQTSKDTVIGGDKLLYPVLGLAGEVGEIVDKVKKLYRDHDGYMTHAQRVELAKEGGDLLWYIAEICTQLEINFSFVAESNLKKLADRADRGVIGGSGDNR